MLLTSDRFHRNIERTIMGSTGVRRISNYLFPAWKVADQSETISSVDNVSIDAVAGMEVWIGEHGGNRLQGHNTD